MHSINENERGLMMDSNIYLDYVGFFKYFISIAVLKYVLLVDCVALCDCYDFN